MIRQKSGEEALRLLRLGRGSTARMEDGQESRPRQVESGPAQAGTGVGLFSDPSGGGAGSGEAGSVGGGGASIKEDSLDKEFDRLLELLRPADEDEEEQEEEEEFFDLEEILVVDGVEGATTSSTELLVTDDALSKTRFAAVTPSTGAPPCSSRAIFGVSSPSHSTSHRILVGGPLGADGAAAYTPSLSSSFSRVGSWEEGILDHEGVVVGVGPPRLNKGGSIIQYGPVGRGSCPTNFSEMIKKIVPGHSLAWALPVHQALLMPVQHQRYKYALLSHKSSVKLAVAVSAERRIALHLKEDFAASADKKDASQNLPSTSFEQQKLFDQQSSSDLSVESHDQSDRRGASSPHDGHSSAVGLPSNGVSTALGGQSSDGPPSNGDGLSAVGQSSQGLPAVGLPSSGVSAVELPAVELPAVELPSNGPPSHRFSAVGGQLSQGYSERPSNGPQISGGGAPPSSASPKDLPLPSPPAKARTVGHDRTLIRRLTDGASFANDLVGKRGSVRETDFVVGANRSADAQLQASLASRFTLAQIVGAMHFLDEVFALPEDVSELRRGYGVNVSCSPRRPLVVGMRRDEMGWGGAGRGEELLRRVAFPIFRDQPHVHTK